jgi:hypothetical protein
MRSLLTMAAFGALLAIPYSAPASAAQSADCGKYGMTCAPMKTPTYTSGVQSPDCGKYGMTCAKSATTASAAPAATSTRLTTGRSVATRVSTRGERLRVGARRASEVRTAAAFPAATAPVAASTTTVRAGYGYGYGPGYGYGYAPGYAYGYGYQPQYWGGGYGYYQPAPAAAPVVTGRSVAVRTTAPAPAVVAAPAAPVVAPTYYWGGYQQPSPWPRFW